MSSLKSLFIGATRQDDGKTMTSLGLFNALSKRFNHLAYMKPVGQHYILVDGQKIDKDALLFHDSFQSLKNLELSLMSPIAVPRGFTTAYIANPIKDKLIRKIEYANDMLTKNKDFILYEGTGHAGVGSVFDMSNAQSAKLLKTKVILVTLGGIGRSVDETMLNLATFQKEGVEVIGVIANKVLPKKYDKIKSILTKSLNHFGVNLLGVIPLVSDLVYPTVPSIIDALKAVCLNPREKNYKPIKNFTLSYSINLETPHNSLLIIPGNDPLLAKEALCTIANSGSLLDALSGILLTDAYELDKQQRLTFKTLDIPILSIADDAYCTCKKLSKKKFKIRREDNEKIKLVSKLVEDHVNIDQICESL